VRIKDFSGISTINYDDGNDDDQFEKNLITTFMFNDKKKI
jgi:hypothetical protein